MSRRGFTLMELIVSIAVLAILAALTFPVFTGIRERGKASQCVSNLHQIGMGMSSYLADWDNRYPWAASDILVVRAHLRPTLRQTLAAHVPEKAFWQCPSDIGEIRPAQPDSYADSYPPSPLPLCDETLHGSSYGYWGFLGNAVGDPSRVLAGRRASEIRSPARAVCSHEICPWHDRGNVKPSGPDWFQQARMNVLYCDGHVSSSPQEQWVRRTVYSPVP